MLNIVSEELVSLTDAAKLLPKRRRGRKPSFCCLWRWSTRGCRGVVLESIRIGGTICTSVQALQRFFDALTAQDSGHGQAAPPIRTSRQRERAVAKADAHLRAEGVLP